MFELCIEKRDDDRDFAPARLSLLRKTLESISGFIDDIELKVSPSGIAIEVMDSGFVAFADIFLSRTIFSSYRADRNIALGIKLSTFLMTLKRLGTEKFIKFSMYCEDDARVLTLELIGEEMTIKHQISLFEFIIESVGLPDMDFCTDVKMSIDRFLQIQKALGDKSSHLNITAKKDELRFSVSEEHLSSSLGINTGDKNSNTTMHTTEEIHKSIPIKYVSSISKAASLATDIKIQLGLTTPVLFEYNLDGNGVLKYFIAPKEEDEDSENDSDN